MKLQYGIVLFCLLKVVCCYPSIVTETQFSDCEIANPAVSQPLMYLDDSPTQNSFPDVKYPTKMLVDTIEPFFYQAADHDDILGPFNSDVKESFKSLEAERMLKEHTSSQDCRESGAELILQRNIAKDSDVSQNTDSHTYNIENVQNSEPLQNTNDTIVFGTNDTCQFSNEKDIETSTDLNHDSNEDKPYDEIAPADAVPAPVTTYEDSLESKQSEETVSIKIELEQDI